MRSRLSRQLHLSRAGCAESVGTKKRHAAWTACRVIRSLSRKLVSSRCSQHHRNWNTGMLFANIYAAGTGFGGSTAGFSGLVPFVTQG